MSNKRGFTLISLLSLCKRSCQGFTLIEILITVAIISTIALLGIPNLKKFNEGQEFQAQVSELTRTIKRAQSNSQSNIICGDNKRSSEWVMTIYADHYEFKPTCPESSSASPIEVKGLSSGASISVKSAGVVCSLPVSISYVNQDRTLKFSSPGCTNPSKLDIDFKGSRNDSSRVYVDLGGAVGQCELEASGVCK